MNKIEHCDYFLESNESIEEIKWSQIYTAMIALEKVMDDINLLKILGYVGYLYHSIYTTNKGDKKRFPH